MGVGWRLCNKGTGMNFVKKSSQTLRYIDTHHNKFCNRSIPYFPDLPRLGVTMTTRKKGERTITISWISTISCRPAECSTNAALDSSEKVWYLTRRCWKACGCLAPIQVVYDFQVWTDKVESTSIKSWRCCNTDYSTTHNQWYIISVFWDWAETIELTSL